MRSGFAKSGAGRCRREPEEPIGGEAHKLETDAEGDRPPSAPAPQLRRGGKKAGEGERAALLRTRFYSRIKRALAGVYLVDRCLLLFMMVLLVQSACSVFLPGDRGGESGSIDIIVRTSSAAIFGYFLSANFNRRTSAIPTAAGQTSLQGKEMPSAGTGEGPLAQIGFQAPSDGAEEAPERTEPPSVSAEAGQTPEDRLQILTAAGIGLFSLLILLLLRWMGTPEDGSATATAAQLRDFVSGCVGFLIGCPTGKPDPS